MIKKNYRKDISGVNTPIKFHLPDGGTKTFDTSKKALEWFNLNYADGYSIVDYVPTQGDSTHPIELLEITVTAPAPKKSTSNTPTRRGVDMYIGANYSPSFNKHFYGTSDFDALFGKSRVNGVRKAWQRNPLAMQNWTDGGNAAATFITAPVAAYGAAEYALPWLAENVAPYMTARGWLGATQAAGNTPAWLTSTSATAIDATLAGSATGASINDMIQNGPTVGNVLGTGLGVVGLGAEAVPTIMEGYNAARSFARPYALGWKLNRSPLTVQNTELPLNVGWGPKQTIPVTHKSDSAEPLLLFNLERWDVVNEGANPLGIWWLGKLGIPRTVQTGNTVRQAEKAVNARRLFALRPYTHSGDLTLEKPLVTIGDVPNRSTLSYLAELLGADGIIYNNVYDNGYNVNLVILGFRQPTNTSLTARVYKGSPRTSSGYEFFTTDPKYASNYGRVVPYYILSSNPVTTEVPLMGTKDPASMDLFVHEITGGKPSDAIIGHDLDTGEFSPSTGDEILIFNPSLARPVNPTPSYLTEAEAAGIPKGERNLRTHGHNYSNPINYGLLYLGREVSPLSPLFGPFIAKGSEASVFADPSNPNRVLKVNTDWRGLLQDFYLRYVLKRNRVPFLKPLIIRGLTSEGFPVFSLERVIPMTDEQYLQNLPEIKEMLYNQGFVGDLDWGYLSNGKMKIRDFNPGNIGFDSKGNIVFIDIDSYKRGGKIK